MEKLIYKALNIYDKDIIYYAIYEDDFQIIASRTEI